MADWFAPPKVNSSCYDGAVGPDDVVDEIPFLSRRSPVICRNGCVASSQPLASSIGLDLLRRGANAAETAIAVAAALGVTEPCSCGLGGDMFCLYYDATHRKVFAVNGSGRSPGGLTLDVLKRDCPRDGNADEVDLDKFKFSAHSVTVPGAAKGFEDLLLKHGSGKFSLAELLEPAAKLAEEGFPVAPVTAYHWSKGIGQIKRWCSTEEIEQCAVPLTVDGSTRGPRAGEMMYNPDLARVLRELGKKGADRGFYQGYVGKAIVSAVQKYGGTMTLDDLKHQTSTFPDPICAQYRDVKLWQVPPNGQGIAGLIALKGLNYLEQQKICPDLAPGRADCYHAMIEMMRLGFADARDHVADPDCMTVSLEHLLDCNRIEQRARSLFNPSKATIAGCPIPSSCTVSFQVVDVSGNAISFVNSNFMGFGTGIVPANCGFTLQNRGFGFCTEPDHPNVVGPRKRPYHTIIPGMLTYADDTNDLYATISNMGGNMQPQGHIQLTVDMVAGGMDPQAAIDTPRFCIVDGTKNGIVYLEGGVDELEVKKLKQKGHDMICNVIGHDRSVFGRAQIIKRDRKSGVLWAGSDGRADGCAMGY